MIFCGREPSLVERNWTFSCAHFRLFIWLDYRRSPTISFFINWKFIEFIYLLHRQPPDGIPSRNEGGSEWRWTWTFAWTVILYTQIDGGPRRPSFSSSVMLGQLLNFDHFPCPNFTNKNNNSNYSGLVCQPATELITYDSVVIDHLERREATVATACNANI